MEPLRQRLVSFGEGVIDIFVPRSQDALARLRDREIVQVVRMMYIRLRRLAVVRVFSGSDRRGVLAFASAYSSDQKGTKMSPASQFTVGTPKNLQDVRYGSKQVKSIAWTAAGIAKFDAGTRLELLDVSAARDALRDAKYNVSVVLARWIWRRNYWDPVAQQSKPRDAARFAVENSSVAEFVADLFVTDPRYHPDCPAIQFGLECSHMAEACHNPIDWRRLFPVDAMGTPRVAFCEYTTLHTYPGSKQAVGNDSWAREFAQWKFGFKVEWVRWELSELNESRQPCNTHLWHFHSADGRWIQFDEDEVTIPTGVCVQRADHTGAIRTIAPQFRRAEPFDEIAMPAGYDAFLPSQWPTCCPHSHFYQPMDMYYYDGDRRVKYTIDFGMPWACYGPLFGASNPGLRRATGRSAERTVKGLVAKVSEISPLAGVRILLERAPVKAGRKRRSDSVGTPDAVQDIPSDDFA